ncbi:MAG: butyrate kinase [Bacteroidetes bacterium]|nr:butyrate kinase [Bacteroidota bacterium]
MIYKILVINPGSTSTKISLFHNLDEKIKVTYHHSSQDLSVFQYVIDQEAFRYTFVMKFLEENEIDISIIDAFIGRGGMLKPVMSGIYLVTPDMIRILRGAEYGEHASNLGALLVCRISEQVGAPSYIANPIVVDELSDIARVSGIPEIKRRSIFHALNQKSAAEAAAAQLGIPYEKSSFIVAHMGGGISVGAHLNGRVIDVNNALNGDGPFSPERSGGLPASDLVTLALSGTFKPEEMHKRICGKGGLYAYCGTHDVRRIVRRAAAGDIEADLYHKAMVYQTAKEIGAMAAVFGGKVDAVVLTGGIAQSETTMELLKERISFIAPIIEIPGEREMYALAENALAAINGTREVEEYQDNDD